MGRVVLRAGVAALLVRAAGHSKSPWAVRTLIDDNLHVQAWKPPHESADPTTNG